MPDKSSDTTVVVKSVPVSDSPEPPANADPHAELLGTTGRRILGVYLYVLVPILIIAVINIWPGSALPTDASGKPDPDALAAQETALAWAVVLLGALGGSLHAVSSFAAFVGNRNLVRSWVWWYTARVPIGASLALIVYLAIRGGLMGTGTPTANSLNPYGIGALSVLAGLFSEVATDKLREVFLTLFRPAETKKNPLTAAAPTVRSVAPPTIAAGSPETTVTIKGEGFESTDQILLDGKPVAAVSTTATELQLRIPAAKLAKAGKLALAVKRGGPRGVESDPLVVDVT